MITREELNEYMKCADDVEYFIETYVKVWHPVEGLISIELNDFQKEAVEDFKAKRFFAKTTYRQKGKTTLAAALILHETLFQEYKRNAIMAPKLQASIHILERISNMYDHLPDFLKLTKIEKRNKTELVFDNSSEIRAVGSNVDHLRGMGLCNIYLDESDFIQDLRHVIECLYPVVASNLNGGRIFAFTTSFTSDAFEERLAA